MPGTPAIAAELGTRDEPDLQRLYDVVGTALAACA